MPSSVRILYQVTAFSLAINSSSLGDTVYSSECCFSIVWAAACYQETRLHAHRTAQLGQVFLPVVADNLCVVKDYSPTWIIRCRMQPHFPSMNSIPGLYVIVLLCTS